MFTCECVHLPPGQISQTLNPKRATVRRSIYSPAGYNGNDGVSAPGENVNKAMRLICCVRANARGQIAGLVEKLEEKEKGGRAYSAPELQPKQPA
ncbi:hypothetical protein AOLI_G00279080 [Acnodon oligacanthus]